MFSTFQTTRRTPAHPASFAASLVMHALLAALLFSVALPVIVPRPRSATPLYLPPESPPPEIARSRPRVKLPMLPAPIPMATRPLLVKQPPPPTPPQPVLLETPPAIALSLPAQSAPLAARPEVPRPQPVVITGLFAAGAAPEVIPQRAQQPTQTGLFAADPVASRTAASIAGVQVGSFGGPSAAGVQSDRRMKSTPAGFDTAETAVRPVPANRIAAVGFEAIAVKSKTDQTPSAADSPSVQTPLEILEKPRPVYTEEARRLRIEGQVFLEARFEASGAVQVLRVVRTLGHGLDESAVAAARAIRFRPAMEHGRPVTAVAMVKITFQLAD